jgi:hypothetical protein
MPIGMALAVGWGDAVRSTWRPTVHETKVPGLWIEVDRVFRPAG